MAKRGYRGKHPHNDMKVSQNAVNNKAANNSKLTDEYNKTGVKNKYDFIKSHDGFYPQATADIICHANIADEAAVTIISTDGTSVTYTGEDDGETAASNLFDSDAADADATAVSLAACINHASGHAGKITATVTDATVTLTQDEPGPDGNSTITNSGTWTGATVASAFTGG